MKIIILPLIVGDFMSRRAIVCVHFQKEGCFASIFDADADAADDADADDDADDNADAVADADENTATRCRTT